MRLLADQHIHSRYSRACSQEMEVTSLAKWARIKGVNLLGTGDFTHPLYFEELKNKLQATDGGRLRPRGNLSADGRPTACEPPSAPDQLELL